MLETFFSAVLTIYATILIMYAIILIIALGSWINEAVENALQTVVSWFKP